MRFETLPNGFLRLSLVSDEDVEQVNSLMSTFAGDDIQFAQHLLDSQGWLGNAKLMYVAPEEVGALTDGVLLTDSLEHDDDGKVIQVGNVWWDAHYAVRHFGAGLLNNGHVDFMPAPENAPLIDMRSL